MCAIREYNVRKTLVLALVICFMTAFGAQAAQINKVAAVVNGQVITMRKTCQRRTGALAPK